MPDTKIPEMVERVAKRLCQLNDGADPNRIVRDSYGLLAGPAWIAYVPDALAAIAAIREPTLKMSTVGTAAYENGNPADAVSPSGIADAWRAMCDQALEE